MIFNSASNKSKLKQDKTDISWIQKETACWVYDPFQNQSEIYKKGVIKGVIPLAHNKSNSKVMGLLQNGVQFDTKAVNLQRRSLQNRLQKDLIQLQVINAAQVLDQLKRKLNQKKIHTYLWNSLIIVNPFQFIPQQYDQTMLKSYIENIYVNQQDQRKLPPHVFGYISGLLKNMKQSDKAQVLSISGQSGSGKTQTNKQCLRTISYCCQYGKNPNSVKKSIQEKILKCDPILQAFGNAKTVKNDNSSRFGKLITLHINTIQISIKHSEIRNFFLQKSRVISQAEGQRNFHIFYQFIKYADPKLKVKHRLCKQNGSFLTLTDFTYLGNKVSGNHNVAGDQQMWHELLDAFEFLNFNHKTVDEIWQIVCAVLLMGNLQYDQSSYNDHQPCQIFSQFLVQSIAQLLQLDLKQFQNGLLFHKKNIIGQIMNLPLNKKQCIQGRDSTVKALYQGLFHWLINQLNQRVNIVQHQHHNVSYQNDKSLQMVKLLDIYGFQVFQKNSFEQLCVNYTNQRIHQIYLDQVFKHEKTILKQEGLEAIISQLNFTDNVKIIELLDTMPKSIYNLLDESCSVNVKDQDFLANVKKLHQAHQHFPSSNSVNVRKSFIIDHTPGHIQYHVQGFRDKNKDLLREDIISKLLQSKNSILNTIFKDKLQQVKLDSNNKKFLGSKIRKQVNHLANQMSLNSQLHFIRCIKPNQNKKAFTFVDRICYNQIKYLGILDTVQLRKDSYHVRMTYQKFFSKYGIIKGNIKDCIDASQGNIDQKTCKKLTMDYMKTYFSSNNLQYVFGNTKMFMKMSTQSYLDQLLKRKTKNINNASTVIKAFYHWKKRRNQKDNMLKNITKIQKAVRKYLKVASQVRKKLAVRVIQKAWIGYYQQYYNRKKRKPLMIIQKYIKRQIQQRKYKQKLRNGKIAKTIMYSASQSNKYASYFQKRSNMKQQFLTNIYDKIWNKIVLNYHKNIQKYVMGHHTRLDNKHLVFRAEKNAKNRLVQAYKKTLQKYLKAGARGLVFNQRNAAAIKIQSTFKMYMYRKKFKQLRKGALIIQKRWRKYKKDKNFNTKYTQQFFEQLQKVNSSNPYFYQQQNQFIKQKQIWNQQLFRSLNYNSLYKQKGQQHVLSNQQKIKKDKIVLFYYLLDFQIFCDMGNIYPKNSWIKNYSELFKSSWEKMNPIQYVDISDSHTVCSTTTKLYSWGSNFQCERGRQDFKTTEISSINITNGGKIYDIQIKQSLTILNTTQPDDTIVYGNEKKFEQNSNKQWKTLKATFVNLNGTILTLQGMNLIRLRIPQKVVQLSCGMGHVVCRTSLKKAYTWGQNYEGQLGLGHFHRVKQPKSLDYLAKNKIVISNISASAKGTILIDTNCQIWWCGTNGTINKKGNFQECLLTQKSEFIDNTQKYSVVRVLPKWSKTMSIIGVTIACHQFIFKNQYSLRKKTIEQLMLKWSQNIHTVNPPYIQNIAGSFLQRHMPLPKKQNQISKKPKGLTQKEIKQRLISQINFMDEIQRELLSSRQKKIQKKINFQ